MSTSDRFKIKYKISNHFHPFVGDMITKLNNESLDGLLEADFLENLGKPKQDEQNIKPTLNDIYKPQSKSGHNVSHPYEVEMKELEIDISEDGPYSIYNWELLFHVPFTIAVHLSKNQRYVEAQRWFHYVFNPTNNDTSVETPERFWNFLAFRKKTDVEMVEDLLKSLSSADDNDTKCQTMKSIEAWRKNPFQPHVIARTRFVAYQLQVIMKYLDNLVAWGDSLFRQDTIEALNEATQLYVLAANILGPKPQAIPSRGTTKPQTFASLRNKLDSFSNALVEMENAFPFNQRNSTNKDSEDATKTLFGIGQNLYFCIPKNDKLLGYWDLVGDRLFKIRHCMNIEGIVRQLPLFQPPIDPGMLVKAAAGGIDIGSLISGLNQPLSPVRSTLLIQKAQEICNEVKSLGHSLLSALEKKDGESIALLRQQQDIRIQELARDVRYLQWKESESSTASLLKSRESVYQRYRYYKTLLGAKEDELSELENIELERTVLSEENFDEVYQELVSKYEMDIVLDDYSITEQANNGNSSGISGLGLFGTTDQSALHLNRNEAKELNEHLLRAKDYRLAGTALDTLAAVLTLIPDAYIEALPLGLGISSELGGGSKLSDASKIGSLVSKGLATWEQDKAGMVSKTASYQRRANDWMLQANLAAKELTQMGRQIISSLIREQITKKEFDNQLQQIEHAKEVDTFLKDKFTNKELYSWMQGELSKLYQESYKFAFDIAKKAEQTMKHELMRPEADERDFIKFNYWDAGRKGLLSGETLSFDLKRMEMAYHDYNKREYELTKHISLNQLNPLALLQLKATGSCTLEVPEWIFDLDCPGHYMRRIKTVAVSIPAITGPHTNVNCTLSLQKSSIRKSVLLKEGNYARQMEDDDDRFLDYFGTIQSIVTSSGQNDSGLFEVNLREERFLPFENAGVESTWELNLPSENRQFDYNTISDVIMHIRYTAREGGELLAQEASKNIKNILEIVSESGLTRLFSLKHDFPNEWHKYHSTKMKSFKVIISKNHFPYLAQLGNIEIPESPFELWKINEDSNSLEPVSLSEENVSFDINDLNSEKRESELSIEIDSIKNEQYFLLLKYLIE